MCQHLQPGEQSARKEGRGFRSFVYPFSKIVKVQNAIRGSIGLRYESVVESLAKHLVCVQIVRNKVVELLNC